MTGTGVPCPYLFEDVRDVIRTLEQDGWIPAEELEDFNANIVGIIEVVAEFHSQ